MINIYSDDEFTELVKGFETRQADVLKRRYMNQDGSFKNGWSGCLLYYQGLGMDKETASRLCSGQK